MRADEIFTFLKWLSKKKYIYGGPSVGVNEKINKTFRFGAINPFNKHVTSSLFI